jgi:hypothetical protein
MTSSLTEYPNIEPNSAHHQPDCSSHGMASFLVLTRTTLFAFIVTDRPAAATERPSAKSAIDFPLLALDICKSLVVVFVF